jgi:cation diffusion facilitator CzcD-associated flavoprotein CzcO
MHTDVLIIGAGPYGFSLAYELHARGIPFRIFGKPMSLWFDHVLPNVQLRSDWRASQLYSRDGRLALTRYLKEHYDAVKAESLLQGRVPTALFRDYLRWAMTQIPAHTIEQKIVSLERGARSFIATTDQGSTVQARRVVIATGIESHRHLPAPLAELPSALLIHGWEVNRYVAMQDRRILVVGGGQSAGEAVALLSAKNAVTWVHRSPLIFFSEPINLPKPLFDLALRLSTLFYHMPTRLRERLGRRFVQTTITPDLRPFLLNQCIQRRQADASQLDLQISGNSLFSKLLDQSFDHVLACTGYRYSLSTLGFLSAQLQSQIASQQGRPVLRRDFATTVPQLYMIGGIAEPSHGPAQRFMFGCGTATRRVGEALGTT